jgi:CRP/FNR family transcriptional regulator
MDTVMTADSVDAELARSPQAAWPAVAYTYPRGMSLFVQGQTLDEVLQIVNGLVKLTTSDAAGAQAIVGLAMAGEWLGTASVIAGLPTPVSAITCSDALLQRIPARTFHQCLRHNQQLSLEIHDAHARELCRRLGWIGQLCSSRSLQRLRWVLNQFASTARVATSGSALKLQLPIHQWELAELIGVTPEHLSRLLKELEHEGVIRREKGWIVLPDPKRL